MFNCITLLNNLRRKYDLKKKKKNRSQQKLVIGKLIQNKLSLMMAHYNRFFLYFLCIFMCFNFY